MKVCYILCYKDPNYVRSNSILSALRKIENIQLTTAINKSTNWTRYFEIFISIAKIRLTEKPDIYILGFRGHDSFPFVRLITTGKPLWFDALMSPYNAIKDERKFGLLASKILSPFIYTLEWLCLHLSEKVCTDTQLHSSYFQKAFQVNRNKIIHFPVGAKESSVRDITRNEKPKLNTLFYGSFLPLHGIDHIIDAIFQLKDRNFHFILIGNYGQYSAKLAKFKENETTATLSLIDWVDYDELTENTIPNADLGFGGPFGNTSQSEKVITGKTSQFLCSGVATIVGKIQSDIPFKDKHNCLLVDQGSSSAIVQALEWADENRKQIHTIGKNGQKLYNESLSIKKIQKTLERELINAKL